MKPPVGYLIKRPDGLYGERGLYFDYVLSGNGVFVEAEGPLLAARVPIAHAEVRGLAPLEARVVLRHGLVPQRFFDLALGTMLTDITKEHYVAVTWNDGYHFYVPEQEGSGGGVEYAVGNNIVLDLHSHGTMSAWFSTTDNKDEQGFKLFGVCGKLDKTPEVRLRVGIYGYHHPVSWGEVFEGSLFGVLDALEIPLELSEEEINKELRDDGFLDYHPSAIERLFHKFRR